MFDFECITLRLRRLLRSLGFLLFQMKFMPISHLGRTHLCQWEFLDLWFLLSPLGPYQKDGWCPDGDLVG